MPPSASLGCLSALKDLRHLIVEYKDGNSAPNLRSIGQLQGLTHIELSLHRSEGSVGDASYWYSWAVAGPGQCIRIKFP